VPAVSGDGATLFVLRSAAGGAPFLERTSDLCLFVAAVVAAVAVVEAADGVAGADVGADVGADAGDVAEWYWDPLVDEVN
jgi:hypothetical protein